MYCKNCGSELTDGAEYCSNCGTKVTETYQSSTILNSSTTDSNKKTGLHTCAFVFMVLSIFSAFGSAITIWVSNIYLENTGYMIFSTLVSLAWIIPMTIKVYRVKSTTELTMGFKICTLLFVNVIAGILLICDSNSNNNNNNN